MQRDFKVITFNNSKNSRKMKATATLAYSSKFINRNYRIKVSGVDAQGNIESLFNRLMKSFIKDGKFSVEFKNIGYAVVTFFGEWGMSYTEYFICKA